MEGCSKNVEACPQLLDLIPKEREWLGKGEDGRSSSEDRKLELRLGPPGEDWSLESTSNRSERHESQLLSCGYFTNGNQQTHRFPSSAENSHVWFNKKQQGKVPPSYLDFPSSSTPPAATATPQGLPVMDKESSQLCCTKVVVELPQCAEKKAFSTPAPANTAVPNSSQKRIAPGPVVGWPPIRSFRKNLATSSGSNSKPTFESQNKQAGTWKKGLFVKINMEGVPIGRKVDLKAYDSYEKLSTAVDELFRGLLAAQRDSSCNGIMNKQEEEKAITGVLDGSGEYKLIYEDNEGDRMLVGDVPWHMFVSTVKRLRVLKSSEVSALNLGSSKHEKVPA
ncbi:PREDICTED: auxin-responsive protein IAA18-like [Populus euphratica]|uniref:Auxin-responsive protein n=1 Tax=Populus euphratica TaxID=75702 RepID=A0AAJ6TQ97_POPEU|nr:PREDICTED: auxin-responsive protein IAA18-like [Populus euphratica]XP_011014933.1 PREDICTED: auxin-responsive protein IAA18-like [Populus euphratica]